MREHKDEIVTALLPDTFKDENGDFPKNDDGSTLMLEIRVLSSAEIQGINDAYKKRSIAVDKKGNPIVANGEVVFRTERDAMKASMRILVDALVYPDLKNKDLMAHYECFDITEMPSKVFPRSDELSHVSRAVMAALGLAGEFEKEDSGEAIADIKN
jgi:hypothetical protein